MAGGRFKEIFKQYGKVALGVHISVSMASTAGLFVAVKNKVDMEPLLEKVGLIPSYRIRESDDTTATDASDWSIMEETEIQMLPWAEEEEEEVKWKNLTAELAASSGGAFAFAFLLNKFLFPVRAAATVALTPLVFRFLSRRRIV